MRSVSNEDTERALLHLEDNYRLTGNERSGSGIISADKTPSVNQQIPGDGKILPAVASGQSTHLPPIKN